MQVLAALSSILRSSGTQFLISLCCCLASMHEDEGLQRCWMQSGQSASDPACRSKGAKARAFPTQVVQGMLWVWPESGPHAWLDSAMQSPAVIPELEDPTWPGSKGYASSQKHIALNDLAYVGKQYPVQDCALTYLEVGHRCTGL